MSPEAKICQNCNKDFTIESNDFSFYEKIKVPPPTFCPDCRCARRMVHRNERSLFKRTCDITGKSIISIYREDCPYTICDKDYYFSDEFDPSKYGYIYNPEKKFFEQFYEFAKKVPLPALFLRTSENCDYNQDMSNSKDCYLCFRTHDSQNMLYTYRGNKSSYCADCFQAVEGSEFLYESVNVSNCSNSQFLHSCEKCTDSAFLYNCVGCIDCFMCTDQRGKQCYYKNEAYSREDYKKIVESYGLSTHAGQRRALAEFEDFLKLHPVKNLTVIRSNNVTGDSIFDSKDSKNVYNVRGLENCSYIWDSMKFKDCMDTYSGANTELVYEATATTKHTNNCHFCIRVHTGSRDCEYSWFLQNCSNCFGCVGLKDKEYCIFNIQYTKEEYFALLEKIKLKMTADGEYGEFFPFYTSPFPYNDTVAQEFFPLDEITAKEKGLLWGDMEEKKHQATLSWDSLPDSITEVLDSITGETISCKHEGNCVHGCTKAFRITLEELAFYRRKNIPLPRECPNCRYYRRLAYRNPTKLRGTTCACLGESLSNGVYQNTVEHEHGTSPCGKDISTTIPTTSGFIIYCDECYKKEVY
jgi:uncharacterized Fe-S cluster protein YjdI